MYINMNTFSHKSNSVFSNQNYLIRRITLFCILKMSLMSGLIEDSCIPLYTSAFNLLSGHTSHSFWKTSLGTPERMRVEKADNVFI